MKSKIYSLLIISILSFAACNLYAQDFEMQLIENEMGYLEVQAREITGLLPTTTTNITQITFEIRWLSSLGADVEFICSNNDYNLVDGTGLGTQGIYNWRSFVANPIPVAYPSNWTLDTWETIATFKVTGTGTGDFEIAPAGWVAQGLFWKDALVPDGRSITLVGSVTNYAFPTIIYDYVWVGGLTSPGVWDEGSWTFSNNWEDKCGGAIAAPTATSNCFIPGGLSHYPSNAALLGVFAPASLNVRIGSGGEINWNDPNGQTLPIGGDIIVDGTLSVLPNASVSISGDTYLEAAECLVVQSDATGIGSFIDNGTVYGTGTAKVQTYLVNGAASGSFQIHLVGPTVDMGGGEVPLSAFRIPGIDTYAYEYDEPTGNWVSIFGLNDPIAVGKGIGLSTADATNYTLEMIGALNYGTIYSPAMTTGGTGLGYNMLSNPYPSSIFWNDMYSDNSGIVDKVYVWDGSPTGGNYESYNTPSSGTNGFTGYLQVGQGFFVEATSPGTFTFNTGQRYHSNAQFYAPTSMANRLDVRIAGTNYSDGLLLHFYEGATSGYEANEDVEKRDSPYETAPEIWTVLEDESRLSINAMPDELLGTDMLSVPMAFKCGLNDTYTLTILDIESFEPGTEIWLEDKQTGEDWISITSEFEYSFTATPDDLKDRFELHFFGPTGLDEFGAKATVDIYSNRNYAYIVNNTEELIKKVEIYTLSGGLVNETNVPDQKAHKLYVANEIGYYLVRVTTDTNVYTNKIFISF